MSQKLLGGLSFAYLALVAPALCFAQAKPDDPGIKEFLTKIRGQNPKVATEFEKLLKGANNDIEKFGPGHVIYGQVVVEGENASRAVVVSQMRILAGGYFVDAASPQELPIGFRLHGYEPVNVTPKEPTLTEDLGIIRLKPLPANRLAAAKGLVKIEAGEGAPPLDQVEATWGIDAYPINTATGGMRGSQPVPIKSKVDAQGKFSISGLSPARYSVILRAPNCGTQFRRIEFAEGETRELEPITLELSRRMHIEFLVSTDGDFRKSEASKTILAANQPWLSTGDNRSYDEDLFIRQKQRKLMLSSSQQPCAIVDLGAAELDEKRDVSPDVAEDGYNGDVPAEDGHVYLVHHEGKKRWVLVRVKLIDQDKKVQTTAKPGLPGTASDTGQNDADKAGSAKRAARTPLTGTKRQDRIKALLAWATANDDEEHGQAALQALDELLELEPENAEGTRLRDKIRKYYPDK